MHVLRLITALGAVVFGVNGFLGMLTPCKTMDQRTGTAVFCALAVILGLATWINAH